MPLTSMQPPTDPQSATQESFFDDLDGFSGPERYETAGADSQEAFYEPEEDFSEEVTEPASLRSEIEAEISAATGHAHELQQETVHSSAGQSADQDEPPVSSAPTASAAPAAEPEAMTMLTVDDFAALEERILRAVNLVRQERQARSAAEERITALEAQLQAQTPAVERLQQEVDSLRVEREQVRQRVERLLGQLDALEL